ncbi:MAG TPA: alpha/beta hydrolase-fold protein [Flavitalea sp.]|nr:alpha/beta hydrolase-fold protein [Flavitalea sp.]
MVRIFFPILFVIITCFPSTIMSQYRVTIILDSLPDAQSVSIHPVFIAGSFNQWNPGSDKMQMIQNNTPSIVLTLSEGKQVFKFTRGSWDEVETNKDGSDRPNREITISGDTVLHCLVYAWKTKGSPRPTTANRHVKILDTAFYMPQLKRTRRIWIYLPEGYGQLKKTYPVIYMHDGQNVFDQSTSFAGEWGVDEAMDTLARTVPAIIVAIDNGGQHRMQEYNCIDHTQFGKAEGKKYLAFIALTLKPYIDAHYNTRRDVANTIIAGSSMGGLISFYALTAFPNIFGKAGIFSPSFWALDEKKNPTYINGVKNKKIFFYYGGKETNQIRLPTERIVAAVKKLSKNKVTLTTDPEGQHNEASWRKAFPVFYREIMKN